jgi:Transglutaminase-like superfamily
MTYTSLMKPLILRLGDIPLFLMLALAPLAGCQRAPSGSGTGVPTQPAADKIDPPPSPSPARAGGQLTEETWDAYSMQGVRVGYAHTIISKVVEDGRELVRTWSEIHMSLKRAGQTTNQDMTLTSWDTADGRLVRFESQMAGGQGQIVSVGTVRDGQLCIDTTTSGRTQSQTIPWQAEWGGFFVAEQSLQRTPLKPGETRKLRGLLPMLNIPADMRLEAVDYEMVDLPRGKTKLLKVNHAIELGTGRMESIAWVGDTGETLKTLVLGVQQEAVRTTRADALQQQPGNKQFDLLLASTVPLRGALPNARETRRAVYRAHLKSGSIAGLFSDCLFQRVQPIDEQTVELTVLAVRPNQPQEVVGRLRLPSPEPADSAPNSFIQSDNALITQMAARTAPQETDSWKVACALEKLVHDKVQNKNFSTAFATAADVAQSLEGDCTEHAVLLAALCRARTMPARVAFGLVYYPPQKGFAYHMWNEVWIKDRWVPLDSTLGLGGIGADHIQLGDSNLAGGSPLADLLNVIQVFGRLELEILEAE